MVHLIFVSDNESGQNGVQVDFERVVICVYNYVYVHVYSNMYIREYTLYIAFLTFIQNIWIRMENHFIPKVYFLTNHNNNSGKFGRLLCMYIVFIMCKSYFSGNLHYWETHTFLKFILEVCFLLTKFRIGSQFFCWLLDKTDVGTPTNPRPPSIHISRHD